MTLDDNIRGAIQSLIDVRGNRAAVAKALGISPSTVTSWMDGSSKEIRSNIWPKLAPMIHPYLPKGYLHAASVFDFMENAPKGKAWLQPDVPPSSMPPELERVKVSDVPVISFAQAAGYDSTIEPFDCYAKNCSEETQVFTEAKPGMFALEVAGDSMKSIAPNGSRVLISPEFAERGDIVAAKIRETGQVVLKQYQRHNGTITLESTDEGRNFEWNIKENPGFLEWMYPVIEITIKPRKLRFQNKVNGAG